MLISALGPAYSGALAPPACRPSLARRCRYPDPVVVASPLSRRYRHRHRRWPSCRRRASPSRLRPVRCRSVAAPSIAVACASHANVASPPRASAPLSRRFEASSLPISPSVRARRCRTRCRFAFLRCTLRLLPSRRRFDRPSLRSRLLACALSPPRASRYSPPASSSIARSSRRATPNAMSAASPAYISPPHPNLPTLHLPLPFVPAVPCRSH